MEKQGFKKGDRVRVVELDKSGVYVGIKLGDKGTALCVDGGSISVRMDKYNENLHCCGELCEKGHGRWFTEHQLELIENETPEPLENWKHPYYGEKVLVRDSEREDWIVRSFVAYVEGFIHPVITLNENGNVGGYGYYKFPDQTPEVPEYTIEEAEKEFNIKIKK